MTTAAHTPNPTSSPARRGARFGSPLPGRIILAAGLLCTACALAFAASALHDRRRPLPRYGHVPDFRFIDERGAPFTTGSLLGQVSVVDFVFTRCTASCPRLTSTMAQLQTWMNGVGSHARLVSFSVDPENDTPDVLKAYAARAYADSARWAFVTGPADDVERAVVLGFKVSAAKFAAGAHDYDVTHGNWLVLVDARGDLRGYYASDESGALDRLKADVLKLERAE